MKFFWKHHKIFVLASIISLLFYSSFAFSLERTDINKLFTLWFSLFFITYKLIQWYGGRIWFLAGIALLFRIVFLAAIPNLSQDFYRFVWDGRMLLEGINPYLSLPKEWIEHGDVPIAQAELLYRGMGKLNGSHYTNYPPVSQLCYLIAAMFSGSHILGAVIVLRILLILADIGTFFYGRKLLKALGLGEERIFWYLLNPFIIIELTGNLHFEGIMVFFIIWGLYLLQKEKWHGAAAVFGLSISVKLIPLLFLPLFFQKLKSIFSARTCSLVGAHSTYLKICTFYALMFATVIFTFTPFVSMDFIQNFMQTLSLWFQNFEFNASMYYIVRWIGYKTVGWNVIETAGKVLPVITLVILILLAFLRKNRTDIELITAMLLGISVYYFLSTTVHPWYIAVPLALSIFTRYKFPVWWSFVIVLSYTAYMYPDFRENLWLVGLEYGVVYGIFIFEVINNTSGSPLNFKKRLMS